MHHLRAMASSSHQRFKKRSSSRASPLPRTLSFFPLCSTFFRRYLCSSHRSYSHTFDRRPRSALPSNWNRSSSGLAPPVPPMKRRVSLLHLLTPHLRLIVAIVLVTV